jgi:hypothetical protein
MNVEPVVAPLVTEKSLALGNFICVVGEYIVNAAAMDVEILAAMLHTDAGAFNVPSGITDTPGAVPLKLLIVELGLCKPENEVALVTLACILSNVVAYANHKLLA